jgi:hypothetical protein
MRTPATTQTCILSAASHQDRCNLAQITEKPDFPLGCLNGGGAGRELLARAGRVAGRQGPR